MFPIKKFSENGVAVVENFLAENETNELKSEVNKMLKSSDIGKDKPAIFSCDLSTQLHNTEYFLTSNDKISLFYERENNEQVNKLGHAMHLLNDSFKKVTFSEKVKDVVRQVGFKDPVVQQTMYILKNPEIGGKVTPHQDASFLHTQPSLIGLGLWMAIDDSTEENGCLRVLPGSHKNGLHNGYRMKRVKVKDEGGEREEIVYEGTKPEYPGQEFVALPVKKGGLILIDGLLVHQSYPNRSTKPRNAYTVHIYDASRVQWDPCNWLQPSPKGNFVHLYDQRPLLQI